MVDKFILPPLARDFSGIASISKDIGLELILYGPGGCDASLKKADESDLDLRFLKTRFNDLLMASGTEDHLITSILARESLRGKTILLLGTSLTEMIGCDYGRVASEVCHHLRMIPIKTNGFWSYKKGIELFYGNKVLWEKRKIKKEKIQIIGHNRLGFGPRKILYPIIKTIQDSGYEIEFLGDSGLYLDGETQWILSPEAESIAPCKGAKRIYGYPVGIHGARQILRQLGIVTRPKNPHPTMKTSRVFIIGEYTTSLSLAQSLESDLGFKYIRIGVLKSEFQAISKNTGFKTHKNISVISDLNLLNQGIGGADIIIGDPLIKQTFDLKEQIFIPLPYRGLSGRYFSEIKYGLVGNSLIHYIEKFI